MKAQLTVNGRTIEVELSTEQLQQLGVEEKRVKKWEDLENIEGWYVSTSSNICKLDLKTKTFNKLKNVFATENQARSALAMAQLSQLMKHVNGEWNPNWNNPDETKYTIEMYVNEINIHTTEIACAFLAFPTFEKAEQFLEDHKALIEEYFLMYK